MENTKIEINQNDTILNVENEDLKQFNKAYFGSFFGNIMEAYLGLSNEMYNFTIVSLEEAYKGKPKINYSNSVENVELVPVSDRYGDAFQFDFKFFFDKDSINIVNMTRENDTVNKIHTNSRVEYGMHNYDIVYIKIKDLTEKEYKDLSDALKENGVTINGHKMDEIDPTDVVHDIENKENVKIVQASVIGSRGWEYNDEDSDLDLRFTYVRDLKDYISISKQIDSIYYPVENGEDYLGYDLGKLLRMIIQQNPFIYEILHSNKQVVNDSFSKKLIDFSDKIFRADKIIPIYQELVSKKIKELESNEKIDVKLAIYIIKTLGTIDYIEKENKYPETNLDIFFKDNEYLKTLLDELIRCKKKGLKEIDMNSKLIDSLKRYLEQTKEVKIEKTNDISAKDIENEANALLYEAVHLNERKSELNSMLQEGEKELDQEKRK